jgi:Peptidase of plants and bacteria
MPPTLPRRRKSLAPVVPPHDQYPTPLLRLEIQDLCDRGARSFLGSLDAANVLEDAVHTVLEQLYPGQYRDSWPGTRSVTLVLHSFGGVAYTQGKSLDNDHKEIHLSTDYVASVKPELLKSEITGVIVHEMVHCYQWNGCNTAPGGLIEGVADWVRLRADLSPPHWKRTDGGSRWDAGYQITAWFLDWLEDKYGPGTVPRLNHRLKNTTYEEKKYWDDRCGFHNTVQELWKEYKKWLADKEYVEKEKAEKKDDQEDVEKRESTGEAAEADGTESDEKYDGSEVEKADQDKNDSKKKHSESEKSESAESDGDSGWTELGSGVIELK